VSELWAACAADAPPVRLEGTVYRLVESQEQVATNALVSTLAEQALLEEMIEASKPPGANDVAGLHYLLSTPFRYPPLPWGSRFGTRFEPSLFYGARNADTALAESAYYRFVFWSGMAEPPPAPLDTRHTLFTADVRTDRGLRLQAPPFSRFEGTLTDRRSYAATQALGAAMRNASVEAFEYLSARDPRRGLNLALFTPAAFAQARPTALDEWLCDTRADRVSFYSRHGGGIREFRREVFLVDGALPAPPA
jgi:hypothetical protein